MSTSTDLARATIRQLIEAGVSEYVLSPGSRNAPLSIALHEAKERGLIELHIKLDERGAGFYAIGISKASNNYVAVICTSGSAAANYHPAVLEALHAENKLLVITADRPERLRKTGANQTTDQVGIFKGVITQDLHTASKIELNSGPVHLNLQFDEPLLPNESQLKSDWLSGLHINQQSAKIKNPKVLSATGNGLLVIGHDRGGFDLQEVRNFADELGLPIIAEDPLSFSGACAHASIFLADEKVREYLKPDYVIVIGRTTLSRSINSYIQSAEKSYVIDPRIASIDSKRTGTEVFFTLPKPEINTLNPSWMSDWKEVSRIASEAINSEKSWSEQVALSLIARELPNESALFIGSSRPIRDIEGFAKPRSGLATFANRGLAGIDGNLSTVFGIATQFERSFGVVGDLTFLHDLSALANLPMANLTLFVIDNNGGGIFSTLPQAGVKGFDEIFGTPQNQDLAQIAKAFKVEVEVVKNDSDLSRVIAHDRIGVHFIIVEVPTRDLNARKLKEVYERTSSALRIGLNLA